MHWDVIRKERWTAWSGAVIVTAITLVLVSLDLTGVEVRDECARPRPLARGPTGGRRLGIFPGAAVG
jgi:hypothetical protein